MSCNNTPVELLLATTDPSLFDATSGAWKWGGQLFWAIECLTDDQTTVSDIHPPQILTSKYSPITTNPATWNFCESQNCHIGSKTMLLVFTFKPGSKDANDFLQYVINIYRNVTDIPTHDITDTNGASLFFDIVEVSKMLREPYIELWISRGGDRPGVIPSFNTVSAAPLDPKTKFPFKIVLIIFVALFIMAVIGIGIYFIFKNMNRQKNVPLNIY